MDEKTIEVCIELHPKAHELLVQLNATGLWGVNVSETAERLLCERLRQELGKVGLLGRLPSVSE